MALVKIKLVPSRKRYLKGKNIYEYIHPSLPVPQRLFNRLKPYFEEDLSVDMTDEDSKIIVIYTFEKKCRKQ